MNYNYHHLPSALVSTRKNRQRFASVSRNTGKFGAAKRNNPRSRQPRPKELTDSAKNFDHASYNRSRRASASPNRSSLTFMRSMIERYMPHNLRLSSPAAV